VFDSERLTEPFGFGESSESPQIPSLGLPGSKIRILSDLHQLPIYIKPVGQSNAEPAPKTKNSKTLPKTKSCNQRSNLPQNQRPNGIENSHKTGPQRPETLKYAQQIARNR
jgi:hypothetical protein